MAMLTPKHGKLNSNRCNTFRGFRWVAKHIEFHRKIKQSITRDSHKLMMIASSNEMKIKVMMYIDRKEFLFKLKIKKQKNCFYSEKH